MVDDRDAKEVRHQFSGWDGAVKQSQAGEGASESVLRRALALNPALKQDLNTQEFLERFAAQLERAQVKQATPVAPISPKSDPLAPVGRTAPNAETLVELLTRLKAWVGEEESRLALQHQTLALSLNDAEAAARDIAVESCSAIVDIVSRVDPNMTSPKTALLFEQERAFFREIGFARGVGQVARKGRSA